MNINIENNSFNFPLNEFELATLNQITGVDLSDKHAVNEIMLNDRLVSEVRKMCLKWNTARISKGLKAWI